MGGPPRVIEMSEATPPVLTEPDETAVTIREYLRAKPTLKKSRYVPGDPKDLGGHGSLDGHCYVASEVYFYANGGPDSDLDVYCLSWGDGRTHWFLGRGQRGGDPETVIDLTVEGSSTTTVPYNEGRRRAFIGGYSPSKRARKVLRALGYAGTLDE